QGSPKHIDTYPLTQAPSSFARSTTGTSLDMVSMIDPFKFFCANVSVALANTATDCTPCPSALSRPFSFGTSTGRCFPRPLPPSFSINPSASASCGTQEGATNDANSTVFNPDLIKR